MEHNISAQKGEGKGENSDFHDFVLAWSGKVPVNLQNIEAEM